MTLLVQVENSLHEVLDDFSDEEDAFIRLCGRIRRDPADDWRVLNIVDPYSDTMLNRIQQMLLRTELRQVRQRPDLLEDAGPIVERVEAALNRVLDGDASYLTFVGE